MIEIVDSTPLLKEFLELIEPEITRLEKGILITIEPVRIILQKSGGVRSNE
jgi:PII-like signaling protein